MSQQVLVVLSVAVAVLNRLNTKEKLWLLEDAMENQEKKTKPNNNNFSYLKGLVLVFVK